MPDIQMVAPNQIDFSKVKSVYFGKAGKCCCGCTGTHSENKGTITKVINKLKIQTLIESLSNGFGRLSFVSATINNRWYIAYFK